jgi:hypothetical protein
MLTSAGDGGGVAAAVTNLLRYQEARALMC